MSNTDNKSIKDKNEHQDTDVIKEEPKEESKDSAHLDTPNKVDGVEKENVEKEDVKIESSEDLSGTNDEEDSNEDEDDDGDDTKNWYIAQTKSNYEFKVEKRLQSLIAENRFKDTLFKVLVPMQQTVELKNNKRSEKNTKIFPGYVFVQMVFEDELAYVVRQIPGVSKFIGLGNQPSPVVEEDILRVLRKVGHKAKEINVDFEVGDGIKVVDGPFRGYTGEISEINPMKGNLKASIKIFGRETPVELDFEQVEQTV
ncbi:transcription termination/antitermination protein NusG [bacterium]|nr:transcription termination/antitermination protein NusG [bacterium]